jgi:7,8-dihydro-6-hydroxymethylpterin-pyrophosphokinase
VTEARELPSTIGDAIDLALGACAALQALGEEIADEWQYVTDLASAWSARLRVVSAARASEPLPSDRAASFVNACAEAERLTDPHRAIDWLSTLPQVVLVAIDERP